MVMEVMKTIVDARPVTSADRFLAMMEEPEYSERNVELIDGEIVEMPKPGGRHGILTMRLAARIANHVYAQQLGEVTAAETGFVLQHNPDGRDSVRGIDIAFIRAAKIPAILPDGFFDFAPDLAVEVLSPSNTVMDTNLKVKQLLQAGTELVWIVDPENRTVLVHSKNSISQLGLEDMLTGGAVLSGFEIPVADIFPA